jgi:hypothetical protein
MSPKKFYDISIMFHIDAMICHHHSTKMELAKLKATHSNGCKGTNSPCQSTQWWIDVFFMYSYGWVDILILVVQKFLGFVSLTFMVCWFQLS